MTRNSELIGYTGLIGENIIRYSNNFKFNSLFNSKKIETIHENKFAFLIFSGASGNTRLCNRYSEYHKKNITC